MTNIKADVVVLGGGPGGYAAAFRSADLGLHTVLINDDQNPGGVCLYRGCIPSKAYLHVAKVLEEAKHLSKSGISFAEPEIDLDKLREHKNGIVKRLTGGLGGLAKARKVNYINGRGVLKSAHTIEATGADGEITTVEFKNLILATGSSPVVLPHLSLDSDRVWDSTDALELPKVPESLLIVGGGVIGMEIGMVYNALGTKVSVVEMLPQLLPGADKDLIAPLVRKVGKQFDKVMLKTKVTAIEDTGSAIRASFESEADGEFEIDYDCILVAVGRRPNSAGLGLEEGGVEIGDRGFVDVDEQMRTNQAHIFAIGDLVGNPMLAHKATHEAHVAAGNIAGKKLAFAPHAIPSVVYTSPEIAWCGLTETQAAEKGVEVEVASFPWAACGRAVAEGSTDGLTKLVVEPDTGRILGMGIVGENAGDLISEGVLAVEMGALATDVAHSIHPHPTVSETVMEAAELYLGHCDHFLKK